MNQLRRSIVLDPHTDEWVRNNIKNFSKFVREAIEDEKALQNTPTIDEPGIDMMTNPFRGQLRMFRHYRDVSERISARWKEEEKSFRVGLKGRWRKWQKTERDVDAGLIPCSDHLGFYKDGGMVGATIEPYGYGMHCAKRLIEYCEARGLTFFIDAESSHAPGACIRIMIYEDER